MQGNGCSVEYQGQYLQYRLGLFATCYYPVDNSDDSHSKQSGQNACTSFVGNCNCFQNGRGASGLLRASAGVAGTIPARARGERCVDACVGGHDQIRPEYIQRAHLIFQCNLVVPRLGIPSDTACVIAHAVAGISRSRA